MLRCYFIFLPPSLREIEKGEIVIVAAYLTEIAKRDDEWKGDLLLRPSVPSEGLLEWIGLFVRLDGAHYQNSKYCLLIYIWSAGQRSDERFTFQTGSR